MTDDDGQKSGILRLDRGGQCDKRRRLRSRQTRTHAELELDRRMQTAFALLTDPQGNVPGKRFYRIREGEGFPWRVLGRAFVDLWRRQVPPQQRKAILRALDAWDDDLQAHGPDDRFPRAA